MTCVPCTTIGTSLHSATHKFDADRGGSTCRCLMTSVCFFPFASSDSPLEPMTHASPMRIFRRTPPDTYPSYFISRSANRQNCCALRSTYHAPAFARHEPSPVTIRTGSCSE
ncbi:hypothetical protein IG631_18555 [Alternaria alternata]|nr:hypothetical protein IG631_18555 [Alternaria alternata]